MRLLSVPTLWRDSDEALTITSHCVLDSGRSAPLGSDRYERLERPALMLTTAPRLGNDYPNEGTQHFIVITSPRHFVQKKITKHSCLC